MKRRRAQSAERGRGPVASAREVALTGLVGEEGSGRGPAASAREVALTGPVGEEGSGRGPAASAREVALTGLVGEEGSGRGPAASAREVESTVALTGPVGEEAEGLRRTAVSLGFVVEHDGEEGDVPRRRELAVSLLHAGKTPLPLCGLQLWGAGLELARWLVAHPERVRGQVVLELGAGTGLLSVAAAKLGARHVIATDRSEVLDLLRRNVTENGVDDTVTVAELDWLQPLQPLPGALRPTLVLAADTVYDDALTAAFFRTLVSLGVPTALLAVEPRTCFSARTLEVAVTGYDILLARVGPPPRPLACTPESPVRLPAAMPVDLWEIVPPGS